MRRHDGVFSVSYRVQAAGIVSLLAVPAILLALAWLLITVSPWLAVAVGGACFLGLQVAVARRWSGGRPKTVSPADAAEVHATVERLCALAGLQKPGIVIHDERYANSWIRGLTRRRAMLHLTSRLLELLDARQLEAVIAHELAHVGQRDAPLMSIVGTPVAALTDGASLYFHTPMHAAGAFRGAWKHRREAFFDPRGEMGLETEVGVAPELLSAAALVSLAWLLLLPIGALFLVIGFVCRAINAGFSRSRELEADAGSALLTGNPAALASALIVLSDKSSGTLPLTDLRRAESLDVFHIVALGREHRLVRTHPPLARRLKQLSRMEERLQRNR